MWLLPIIFKIVKNWSTIGTACIKLKTLLLLNGFLNFSFSFFSSSGLRTSMFTIPAIPFVHRGRDLLPDLGTYSTTYRSFTPNPGSCNSYLNRCFIIEIQKILFILDVFLISLSNYQEFPIFIKI